MTNLGMLEKNYIHVNELYFNSHFEDSGLFFLTSIENFIL